MALDDVIEVTDQEAPARRRPGGPARQGGSLAHRSGGWQYAFNPAHEEDGDGEDQDSDSDDRSNSIDGGNDTDDVYSSDNPCAVPPWFGITCNTSNMDASSHVTHLELPFNNVTGQFPELTGLIHLKVLNLNFNSVDGTTPNSVCSLGALQELNVKGCRLWGQIPDCIGACTELRIIDYVSET